MPLRSIPKIKAWFELGLYLSGHKKIEKASEPSECHKDVPDTSLGSTAWRCSGKSPLAPQNTEIVPKTSWACTQAQTAQHRPKACLAASHAQGHPPKFACSMCPVRTSQPIAQARPDTLQHYLIQGNRIFADSRAGSQKGQLLWEPMGSNNKSRGVYRETWLQP